MGSYRKEMQHMWDATAKPGADGQKKLVFVGDTDILNLYYNGTFYQAKHTDQEFLKSFAACKQKDGSYQVDYDTWMAQEKYYAGPIQEGWDPWTLREGNWSEVDLLQLYRDHIASSSLLLPGFMKKFIEAAKAKGVMKNDQMKVDAEFKATLTGLINRYPSPPRRRWMELIAYQLALKEVGDKLLAEQKISTNPQASALQQTNKGRLEKEAQKLKDLERSKSAAGVLENTQVETMSLSDLQKKRAPKKSV